MSAWSLRRHGPVAVLTFSSPPKNYLGFADLIELGDLLETCAAEPDAVKTVVLASDNRRHFVNQLALGDLVRAGEGLASYDELSSWGRALRLLEEIPQPTVAAIDGLASGGGNELALACTVRIGSTRARLEQPEVKVGIIPGGGGSVRLPRLIGPGAAAEAILTGRPYGAEEALRVGWLTLLFPSDDFHGEVLRWCEQVAAAPARALSAAKASVVHGSRLPFKEAQQLELTLFRELTANNDALGQENAHG